MLPSNLILALINAEAIYSYTVDYDNKSIDVRYAGVISQIDTSEKSFEEWLETFQKIFTPVCILSPSSDVKRYTYYSPKYLGVLFENKGCYYVTAKSACDVGFYYTQVTEESYKTLQENKLYKEHPYLVEGS